MLQRLIWYFVTYFMALITSIESDENQFAQRHKFANFSNVVNLPLHRFPEPRCAYTVRRYSRHGPLVTSQVGIDETLYHSWNCAYNANTNTVFNNEETLVSKTRGRMYCMMVHNCTVTKDRSRKINSMGSIGVIEMIDEFGCSQYPQVLPEVRYVDDLHAYVASQAFALEYDKPAIFFTCNIRLLLKSGDQCRRPRCPP